MKKYKLTNNYINKYLTSVSIKCKKSTLSNYIYVIDKRIKPYLLNKVITTDTINNYTNILINNNLSTKTIKDTLIILNSILTYNGININIIKPKVVKKDIKVLTKEDEIILESYILNNVNNKNIGILLSLYTGLRIGEICALKWNNIDFINNIIHIDNTIIRIKDNGKTKVIIDSPKTTNSKRIVPIPIFIKKYLLELKSNDNYYILSNNIKYIEPRIYLNYYKKILSKLNLDNTYNFHTLRHTFATRCVISGCDIKTLSLILGHSSINITLGLYVHPDITSKHNLINKLKPLC